MTATIELRHQTPEQRQAHRNERNRARNQRNRRLALKGPSRVESWIVVKARQREAYIDQLAASRAVASRGTLRSLRAASRAAQRAGQAMSRLSKNLTSNLSKAKKVQK